MQERKFVFVEETLCGRGIGGVAISHEEGKINLQKKRNEMNRTRDSAYFISWINHHPTTSITFIE